MFRLFLSSILPISLFLVFVLFGAVDLADLVLVTGGNNLLSFLGNKEKKVMKFFVTMLMDILNEEDWGALNEYVFIAGKVWDALIDEFNSRMKNELCDST